MTNQHEANESMNSDTINTDNKKYALETASTDALAAAVLVLMHRLIRPPLFALGHVVATRGALDLLDRTSTNASLALEKHRCGDWGVVCQDDAAENNRAVIDGGRILSVYALGERHERLWIITERDRSVTTLLCPEEY